MMHSHFVLYLVLITFAQKRCTGRKETIQRNFGTKLIGQGNKQSQPKQGVINCDNDFNSPICIYSRYRITWGSTLLHSFKAKMGAPKGNKNHRSLHVLVPINNYPDCQWMESKQSTEILAVETFLGQHWSILICGSPRQLKVAKQHFVWAGAVCGFCSCAVQRHCWIGVPSIFNDHFHLSWEHSKSNLPPTHHPRLLRVLLSLMWHQSAFLPFPWLSQCCRSCACPWEMVTVAAGTLLCLKRHPCHGNQTPWKLAWLSSTAAPLFADKGNREVSVKWRKTNGIGTNTWNTCLWHK